MITYDEMFMRCVWLLFDCLRDRDDSTSLIASGMCRCDSLTLVYYNIYLYMHMLYRSLWMQDLQVPDIDSTWLHRSKRVFKSQWHVVWSWHNFPSHTLDLSCSLWVVSVLAQVVMIVSKLGFFCVVSMLVLADYSFYVEIDYLIIDARLNN